MLRHTPPVSFKEFIDQPIIFVGAGRLSILAILFGDLAQISRTDNLLPVFIKDDHVIGPRNTGDPSGPGLLLALPIEGLGEAKVNFTLSLLNRHGHLIKKIAKIMPESRLLDWIEHSSHFDSLPLDGGVDHLLSKRCELLK